MFGKVLEGEDTTLDEMEDAEVDGKNRPKVPIKIQSVTIHANPVADEG